MAVAPGGARLAPVRKVLPLDRYSLPCFVHCTVSLLSRRFLSVQANFRVEHGRVGAMHLGRSGQLVVAVQGNPAVPSLLFL